MFLYIRKKKQISRKVSHRLEICNIHLSLTVSLVEMFYLDKDNNLFYSFLTVSLSCNYYFVCVATMKVEVATITMLKKTNCE